MKRRYIPYGRQSVDEPDIAAVVSVLRGDWITQGPTVERFEQKLAERVGAKYAVTFSSGTAALHAAVAAAGLASDDVVVTSPLTFIASANCARYVGATVALTDIDPATLNLDIAALPAEADAVVAVHYAGLPVDLARMTQPPGVVIEDASHALGATTADGPVGNCRRSDICVFSLHAVKPITTGEGGVATTNNTALAERLKRFRSHGIVPRPERGAWCYDVESVGYNYRMTDIQAALGLSQLTKLDTFIARRNEIASRYREVLAELPVTLPPAPVAGTIHGYHLFPILVSDRGKIFEGLRAAGIGAQVHYVPVHHHAISADIKLPPAGLPVVDAIYERILSLPIYPGLDDDDQNYVAETLGLLLERLG